MTTPNETVTKFIYVTDAASAAVTGLTSANFTFTGFKKEPGENPTTYSLGSQFGEIGGGFYYWTYSVPAVAAHHGQHILPVNPAHFIEIVSFSGETENFDLASLGARLSEPVGGITTAFALGATVAYDRPVYRERATIQAFSGIDLSTAAYNNWKIGIRSTDQITTIWECDANKLDGLAISGDDQGNLSLTLPESLVGPLSTTWTASRIYTLGNYVVPTTNNGFVYEATVAGTNSGTQPTWPTSEGATVTDGGVTWTCRKRSIWLGITVRAVGDMVRPTTHNGFIYRCIVAGTSSGTQPTWPTTPGATITDGTITWKCLSNPDAALPAGTESAVLRYEITADALSTAKTRPVIPSSNFTLKRSEVEV